MKTLKPTTVRKSDGNTIRIAGRAPFARRGKAIPASRRHKDARRQARVNQRVEDSR